MPPDASYKTWEGQPAIFAEDKNLMTVRKLRVLHPDAWSQRPLWATNHVVSNVSIRKEKKNGDLEVTSRFHMMELRRDDVRHFAGLFHKLKKTKRATPSSCSASTCQRAGGVRLRAAGVGLAAC
jgi:3-phenylpropionate/cinnamic acid dioxygenase small subunit